MRNDRYTLLYLFDLYTYIKLYNYRQIKTWPPPFSSTITPYCERDFDDVVKRTCAENPLTLRISKVIVIGDVTVGKTSLVNRYNSNEII